MNHMPNSPEARDIAYHFHSYTNAIAHAELGPMVIERGEGVHVFDNQGRKYIEAMAGLWSAALGFSEERLINAAANQMRELPFYHNFTHKSHTKAIDLAEKLVTMAPVPMSKAFFTNSGSEANDTVLKMIWYRSNSLGLPDKKKIISRNRGYHGVTLAAGSLTGLPYNHKSFDMPIDRIYHTTCPHYWREGQEGESEVEFATRCANDLEELILAEGPETVAAFFAEPVMGAGGVVVPPETYCEKIQAVLEKYDVLLVADEVICGFGRTGNMFGSETFGMKPDVMVMSKQITSSYAPFSAILVNERFYEPIAEETGRIGVLGHGYTGAAHPVGAAVALENIAIIEERDLVAKTRENSEHFLTKLRSFADHPNVGEVRGVGMIAGLELVTDKETKKAGDMPAQMGLAANKALLEEGIIIRNIVDTVAFCPPLIIEPNEIDTLLGGIEKMLDAVHKQFPV